jgi:hypothetical protein
MTKRQGVKINAALSMIYSEGYEAQTVVDWARGYQRQGYPMAKSYERALNEFIGGQPKMQAQLVRINRLLEASDDASIDKYESALAQYVETGDGSAIEALAPMIARDGVELARRNGDLQDGAVTAASIEAALGFPMAEQYVQAAASEAGSAPTSAPAPAAPPAQQGRSAPLVRPNAPAPQRQQFAFRSQQNQAQQQGQQVDPYNNGAQVSAQPYCPGQARMNATFSVASTTSRTILEGRVVNPVADGVVGEVGL